MRALRWAGNARVFRCEWGRRANQDSRANPKGANRREEGRCSSTCRKTRGSDAGIAVRVGGAAAYGSGAGPEKREKARRGVPAVGGVRETLCERRTRRARGVGSRLLRLQSGPLR